MPGAGFGLAIVRDLARHYGGALELPADNGFNFRISDCQWVYNLNSKALGAGTYQIGLSGDGVTGTATFTLK